MQRNTTLPCQLSSLIQTKFWPQPTFKWAHGAHVKEFMAPTSLQAAHLWWHIIWLNLIERYQYTLWLGPSFSVTRPYFQWDCRACVKNLEWNKTTINLEKELMLDHGRGQELLVKEALPIILYRGGALQPRQMGWITVMRRQKGGDILADLWPQMTLVLQILGMFSSFTLMIEAILVPRPHTIW